MLSQQLSKSITILSLRTVLALGFLLASRNLATSDQLIYSNYITPKNFGRRSPGSALAKHGVNLMLHNWLVFDWRNFVSLRFIGTLFKVKSTGNRIGHFEE